MERYVFKRPADRPACPDHPDCRWLYVWVKNGQHVAHCLRCRRPLLFNLSRAERNAEPRRLVDQLRGVTPKRRLQALERDGHRCTTPGCPTVGDLHVDHIVPVEECARLGWTKKATNALENLRTLCQACNSGKGPDVTLGQRR